MFVDFYLIFFAVSFVSTRNSKRFIIINTKPRSRITRYSFPAVFRVLKLFITFSVLGCFQLYFPFYVRKSLGLERKLLSKFPVIDVLELHSWHDQWHLYNVSTIVRFPKPYDFFLYFPFFGRVFKNSKRNFLY